MNLPANTIPLHTYAELHAFAGAFAQGKLNLLVVLGTAGVGKSRALRRAVGSQAHFIEGHTTPFVAYCLLYDHCHQPIVFDDADSLLQHHDGIRLLKSLCQRETVKRVSWQSANRTLEQEDIPRAFETTSKVTILANRWCPPNADVAALQDRGHLVQFQPSALELHLQTASWFWDQEVFDFLGQHLHLIAQPSMRLYERAWELRLAGMDWQTLFLQGCLQGKALAVAKLKADPRYPSEEARARAFVADGHGCRATYFNQARKLPPPVVAPPLRLTHPAPPARTAASRVLTADQVESCLPGSLTNRAPEHPDRSACYGPEV